MARKLIAPLSWAALVAALLAFGSFSPGLEDALAVPLLNAAVLLAVLGVGARLAAGAPLSLPASSVWCCAALYTFWALASRAWAAHPAFVGHASYLTIGAFFLFLLLPQLLADRRRAARVAVAYLVASTLLAVGSATIMRVARAGWEGYGEHSRLGFAWPTGNPNFTALILEPGLLLAVAAATWTQGSRRVAALAVAALHLDAILLTGSKGALAGAGVGALVLVGALGGRRWRIGAVAVALLGALAVAALLLAPGWVRATPAAPIVDDVERSLGLRRVLAREAIRVWRETPRTTWVGQGIGGYLPAAIPHKQPGYYWHAEHAFGTPHPHGVLWRVLAELGVVGALLLAALLVALVLRARALLTRGSTGGDAWARRHGAVTLAVTLALMAHGQLTVWLDHPLGLFLWWGWAGALAAPLERPEELPAELPRPLVGAGFAALFGGALAGFYGLYALSPLVGRLTWREAELQLRAAARQAEAAPVHRRAHISREAHVLAEPLMTAALARMTERGESERTLELRIRAAEVAFATGRRELRVRALNELYTLDRAICPGYELVDWRIARWAAMLERPDLANAHYLRHFDRMTLHADPYRDWWDRRAALRTPEMAAAVLVRIEEAIRRLEAGRDAGQLAPDDKRLRALTTLRDRMLLPG